MSALIDNSLLFFFSCGHGLGLIEYLLNAPRGDDVCHTRVIIDETFDRASLAFLPYFDRRPCGKMTRDDSEGAIAPRALHRGGISFLVE